MKVLLVEDDRELARQLAAELAADGWQVQVESAGPAAVAAALRERWDVAVLDIALPGLSGLEVLRQLRERRLEMPVIFLTAKTDVEDRVRGLAMGGDDYLTKPFAKDELKARLHALCRRGSKSARPAPALPKGWKLDPLLRQVTIGGAAVSLQPREWSLLELFLNHEGEVLTRSFLLDRAWGIRFDPGTNVVEAVVCRLRRKLDQPGKPSHIGTLRGRGFVFRRDV